MQNELERQTGCLFEAQKSCQQRGVGDPQEKNKHSATIHGGKPQSARINTKTEKHEKRLPTLQGRIMKRTLTTAGAEMLLASVDCIVFGAPLAE